MRNPEKYPADIIAAAEIAVDRGWHEGVIDAICEALMEERERCAKIAEDAGIDEDAERRCGAAVCFQIAAAIRINSALHQPISTDTNVNESATNKGQ